ncbi:MAG: hypothetical protein LQ352_006700, partial [Teloschistes flavicans]
MDVCKALIPFGNMEKFSDTSAPPEPPESPEPAVPVVPGFLRLPPELRLQIYHYLLPQQTLYLTWSRPPHDRNGKKSRRKRFSIMIGRTDLDGAAIIRTSRLIRLESLPIFYDKTHFRLDLGPNPIFGLNAFRRVIGSQNANCIRLIALELNLRTEPYRGWRDVTLIQRLGR